MKSIAKFHAMADEQLSALSTRLLLEVLKGTRALAKPEEGAPLAAAQLAFNQAQAELQAKTRAILATREQVERKEKPARKAQKKAGRMAY